MPRMSQLEYQAYLARRSSQIEEIAGLRLHREAELHYQILEECRRRGWIAFHGSMAHRSRRTVGEVDFTIAADGGRVFFIEAKSTQGKLSAEQTATIAWLKKLGHAVSVVRSFEDFLEMIADQ